MLFASMPNSETFGPLVDNAMKCLATADSFKNGEKLLVGNKKQIDQLLTYILSGLQEPLLGGHRVGDGLLCGKGLWSYDEEGGLGIQLLQRLSHMSAVDVGNKVNIWANLKRLQSLCDHERALKWLK